MNITYNNQPKPDDRSDNAEKLQKMIADTEQNIHQAEESLRFTDSETQRQQIEATVEKVLKKKVIMTYKVDPSVIGGLVAQAGSYTFDDSLNSHLQRLNDELKRRAL